MKEKLEFSLTEKETEKVVQWAGNIKKSFSDIDHECFGLSIVYEFSPFEFGEQIIVKYVGHELVVRSAWEDDEV